MFKTILIPIQCLLSCSLALSRPKLPQLPKFGAAREQGSVDNPDATVGIEYWTPKKISENEMGASESKSDFVPPIEASTAMSIYDIFWTREKDGITRLSAFARIFFYGSS